MKIPKTFIPKKNLDNKIFELAKGAKNHPLEDTTKNYNELDLRIAYNEAIEVAETLGELDSISSAYTYEDKKTGMIIEYHPWYHDQTTHLRIYKPHEYSFSIVFKANQGYTGIKEVLQHIPGKWQERLKELYQMTQQK